MPFKKGNEFYKTNGFQKGNTVNLGKKYTKERSDKINKKNKGQKRTPEQIKRISDSHKGQTPWNKGRKETRLSVLNSLSQSHIGKMCGEKCHLWRGGIHKSKYPKDWTETLRRSIRERDNYTCVICLKQQGDKAHAVHHIDYNKNNCNPENLITLCDSCHTKTNINRDYWLNYFNNKNEKRV